MTDRLSLRRRVLKPDHHHHRGQRSPASTSRGRSKSRRNLQVKSIKLNQSTLTRCASAPALFFNGFEKEDLEGEEVSVVDRERLECDEGVLARGNTCGDVLSTSAPLSRSFRIYEESYSYDKEAKVVVNVTMEGSAGPMRVMVRLGSSVEEMIAIVLKKYDKEGRRPKLGKMDEVSFELHDSYFSLQCLGKSELIGDVGGRTFYLRTSKKASTITPCSATQSATSLIVPEVAKEISGMDPTMHPALLYLPGFISRRICKLIRRSRTLWKILGCLQS